MKRLKVVIVGLVTGLIVGYFFPVFDKVLTLPVCTIVGVCTGVVFSDKY